MRILIVEDWWADRLRFEYLLSHIKGIRLEFAWSAGRLSDGGGVWPIERIVRCADDYDRLIIDLALTKSDEDHFREAHEWSDTQFSESEKLLDTQITGLKLIKALSRRASPRGTGRRYLKEHCIIASAHVYDRLRDHCIDHWGIVDTFHKWSDEDQILRTLYDSKFRKSARKMTR